MGRFLLPARRDRTAGSGLPGGGGTRICGSPRPHLGCGARVDEAAVADRRVRRMGREHQSMAGRPPRPDSRASVLDRLDAGRWSRDSRGRGRAPRRVRRSPSLASCCLRTIRHLHRVGRVPRDDPDRPPRSPRGRSPGEPSCRRELPVWAHGRGTRPVRRVVAHPRVARPSNQRDRRSMRTSGRDPALRRVGPHVPRDAPSDGQPRRPAPGRAARSW